MKKIKEGEIYLVVGKPITVIKVKKMWKDYFDLDELFTIKTTMPHALSYYSDIIKNYFRGPNHKVIIRELFKYEKK